MNKPTDFDVWNYRARATNARKMPLYVGQGADEARLWIGRLGYAITLAGLALFAAMLLHVPS